MEGEHHGAEVAGNWVSQIEVGLDKEYVNLERTVGNSRTHSGPDRIKPECKLGNSNAFISKSLI